MVSGPALKSDRRGDAPRRDRRGNTLRRDRRGATAVEFALVGSTFFVVLLLLMESCWQVAVAAGLDSGGREAARWAATGQPPPVGQTATGYVTELVLRSSGMPLGAAGLSVTVDNFAGFGQLATPAAAKPGLGGPGDVVRYTIVYRSSGLTPFGRALLPLGVLQHQFVVLAKNEPFPIAAWSSGAGLARARTVISVVSGTGGGNLVNWTCSRGDAGLTNHVAGLAALPNSFVVPSGQSVMVVEIINAATPWSIMAATGPGFFGTVGPGPVRTYAILRPRAAQLTSIGGACP